MIKLNAEKTFLSAMVCSMGAYQIYDDYKKTDKEDKKNVLLRDTFILAGSVIGAYSGYKLLNKPEIPNSKKTAKIIRHFLNNLSIPLGGIIAGIATGEVVEKKFPLKSKNIEKTVKDKIDKELFYNIDISEYKQNLEPGTIGKAYGYLGNNTGFIFDDSFSVLSGFNVGREEGFKNKLLKASYEIISGEIIPVTGVVSTALYLKSKNIKGYKKNLIIAPIAIAGCILGNKVGKWFNEKITENLTKQEFYKQIYEKQKNLALFSIINKTDPAKIQQKLQKLHNIKTDVEHLVKTPEIKRKIKQVKKADAISVN